MDVKTFSYLCSFCVVFVFSLPDVYHRTNTDNSESDTHFLNLAVAFNSTNNIKQVNGNKGMPVHINEGGDLLDSTINDNLKSSIKDKNLSIVDPVNEYEKNNKSYVRKSSIHSRKGVDTILTSNSGSNSSMEPVTVSNISQLNISHVNKNSSVSNKQNQTSTDKKPHKPLVTNIADEEPLIIPDLPPLAVSGKTASIKDSGILSSLSTGLVEPNNKDVQGYNNTSTGILNVENLGNENVGVFKKYMDPLSKAHPSYIIPIVITIFAVPLFGILGLTALKRAREAWKNRHYRRMDFLIDGMYND